MDSREAIIKLRIELQAREWLQPPERLGSKPLRLFHYTPQVGLIGIVDSNVLWATNAFYLNDSSELAYGLSVARERITALARRGDLITEFLRRGESLLDWAALLPNRQFYACCFCEDSDLLSQWRAYSDRGGGYAVGFDIEDLTEAGIKQHLSLFPVEYGAGPHSELLTHDLNALCDALERCCRQSPGNEEQLLSAASDDLKLTLIYRLLSLKHPGFKEEKEWRILANFHPTDPSRLRFRPGQTAVVPYIELGVSDLGGSNGKLRIREVVHGPSAHSQLASQSVASLFEKHGFDAPAIRGSTIPLRTT
jgi:Protein of unknown function (DUF2971)